MTFRPPLTDGELHDICSRRDGADVVRLCWEIKRLRAIALQANQVLRDAPMALGPIGIVQRCLLDELAVEPVIMEMETLRIKSQS